MSAPTFPHAPLFKLLGTAFEGYVRHRSSMLASGLSFRTLLSVAPLLVVAQALVSAWVGAVRGRTAILAPIGLTIGTRAEHLVAGWLDAARAYSGAATTIGVVLFLVGATRLVLAIDAALDAIFDVPVTTDDPWHTTITDWLKVQAKALGVTVGLVVMIGIAVGLETLLARALHSASGDVASAFAHVAQWLLASVFLVGFLGLVYAALPSVHMSVRDVAVAAVVSAGVLEVGIGGLWLYFHFVDVGAAYGAAGAVVLLLVWLYYSAEAFVLGAEIAAAERSAHRARGSRRTADG